MGPSGFLSPPLPGPGCIKKAPGRSELSCERPKAKRAFPGFFLLQNVNSQRRTKFSDWFLKLSTTKLSSNCFHQLTEEVASIFLSIGLWLAKKVPCCRRVWTLLSALSLRVIKVCLAELQAITSLQSGILVFWVCRASLPATVLPLTVILSSVVQAPAVRWGSKVTQGP